MSSKENYEPGNKKKMVMAVGDGLCIGRCSCRILRLAQTAFWYRAGQRSDAQRQMITR
jgi:hypothetical protein